MKKTKKNKKALLASSISGSAGIGVLYGGHQQSKRFLNKSAYHKEVAKVFTRRRNRGSAYTKELKRGIKYAAGGSPDPLAKGNKYTKKWSRQEYNVWRKKYYTKGIAKKYNRLIDKHSKLATKLEKASKYTKLGSRGLGAGLLGGAGYLAYKSYKKKKK